jgi:hypothetical protein
MFKLQSHRHCAIQQKYPSHQELKHGSVNKKKIKCTLVQALRLCTGHMARRGSRGIALLFLDHSTKRGLGVSVMPRPLFTPRKDPVPIVQEAGWGPGPVWKGAEYLGPTGIRSPDRPTRSLSLYRPCYPAHLDQWMIPPKQGRCLLPEQIMKSLIQIFNECRKAPWNHLSSVCSLE